MLTLGAARVPDMISPSIFPSRVQTREQQAPRAASPERASPNRQAPFRLDRELSRLVVTPVPALINRNGKRRVEVDEDEEQYEVWLRLEERREREEKSLQKRQKLLDKIDTEVATLQDRQNEILQMEAELLKGKDAVWLAEQQRKYKSRKSGAE